MQVYTTEEEQLQVLLNFFKKHGIKLIVLFVLIIVSVVGWQYYLSSNIKYNTEASVLYNKLQTTTSDNDQKEISQNLVKHYKSTVYGKIARVHLANQLVNEQKWQEASDAFHKIYKETGSWPDLQVVVFENWLRSLMELQQYDKALKILYKNEKVAKLYPVNYYNLKGDILSRLNKQEEAVEAYNQALQSAKKDAGFSEQMTQFTNWITLKRNDLLLPKQLS